MRPGPCVREHAYRLSRLLMYKHTYVLRVYAVV